MNDLQPFDVLGANMRFGATEDGTPYVVAVDFARALDYRDAHDAKRLLDDDEVGTQNLRVNLSDGRVQVRELDVFYEDGIWELVFLSRKPEAKLLKKRVKAILRQLRETGTTESRRGAQPAVPNSFAEALELAARQARELEEQRPKVEAFDAFLNGEGCYLVDSVANMIDVRSRTLWKLLYDEKLLIGKGSRKRQPYANPKSRGWFKVRTHDEAKANGHAATTTYGAEQIRLLAVKRGLIEPQLLALTGGAGS